jgi:hypothetical protein
MTQTYDPILVTEDLPRIRFTSPVRGPAMGTALVLERTVGDPLVVWAGSSVPDARTGNYRRLHRVDVANRGLELTTTAPSADPAFPFSVTVRMSCRVTDPAQIVRDGVHDMTAALAHSFDGIVRRVAAGFDALEPGRAEAAIARELDRIPPIATVALSGFSVRVTTVDAEQIVTEKRRLRVSDMRRDAMRPIAAGDRAEMLAHYMAIGNGDPTDFLAGEAQERAAEREAQLDALRVLMGAGDLEGFSASDVRRKALNTFFGDDPADSRKRGGIRDRIERKSRGELGAGNVVDGDVSDETEQRPKRLRGTMRPRDDKPEQ